MMEKATRFCNALSVMTTTDILKEFDSSTIIVVKIDPKQMEKLNESESGLFLGFDDDSGVILVNQTETVLIISKEHMEETLEEVVKHESNSLLLTPNIGRSSIFSN